MAKLAHRLSDSEEHTDHGESSEKNSDLRSVFGLNDNSSDSEGDNTEDELEEKGKNSLNIKDKRFDTSLFKEFAISSKSKNSESDLGDREFEQATDKEDEEEEEEEEGEEEEFGIDDLTKISNSKQRSKALKSLDPKEVDEANEKVRKSGLVYISRIPPYMSPARLKQVLSRFGTVNRIFLTPEDAKIYAKRVKYHGNRQKNYTEGWAEFTKKKHAKTAAATLNGNNLGGKKGSKYYDDILNVKYLPKFKWNDLTEQILHETQTRQARMRAEIAQATRENKTFISNVEKAKMIEGISAKRSEKGQDNQQEELKIRRTFEQRPSASKRARVESKVSENVANVLRKVF